MRSQWKISTRYLLLPLVPQHTYTAGSTEKFGAELADRSVTTLTYAVGDEVKAVAAIFPL